MRLRVVALTPKLALLEWDVDHVLDIPRIWFPAQIRVGDVLEVQSFGEGRVTFKLLEADSSNSDLERGS